MEASMRKDAVKPWRKKTLTTARRRNKERMKMGKALLHLYAASAYNIYLVVQALHDIRGYEMVSGKIVKRLIKGLVRRHVLKWGHQSL